MDKTKRAVVIAGNWKMNKTAAETKILIQQILPAIAAADCTVVACVPFTDIAAAVEAAKGSNLHIGAQNCHFAASGAYTGEISAAMLAEAGIQYVIIGHSERRQYFGETNETVNLRACAALQAGLKVILCVGELLSQREDGTTQQVLKAQIEAAFRGIPLESLKDVIIAYEPVWAIGTGKTATSAQANEACAYIRSLMSTLYTASAADAITIQYGGSMNAQNAGELLAQTDVDGGLIGGASLKAEDFAAIVSAAGK